MSVCPCAGCWPRSIPGVLAYREWQVIDVASGRDVTGENVN
jgi:hypothetical protein